MAQYPDTTRTSGVDASFYVRDTTFTNLIRPYSGYVVTIEGGNVDNADSLGGIAAIDYLLKSLVGDSVAAHLKDSLYARYINNLRDSINIAIA